MDDTAELKGYKEFFASLGQCITFWARIERVIFTIFRSTLGADEDKSALLFWKLPNLSTRLDYTSMLVEHCLKTQDSDKVKIQEAQKAWNDLRNELKTLAEFRNKLAHQPVSEVDVFSSEDGKLKVIIPKAAILPNKLNPHKKSHSIGLDDLRAHMEGILEAHTMLYVFLRDFVHPDDLVLPPDRLV
jgi:hypothetical protein